MKNMDSQQLTVLLTKQKLRERIVSCSFNRSTRLIAVSFRDNSLTIYDTNWVARLNFACFYNGNPIELKSVAFTSMRTVIATVYLNRTPSAASPYGQPAQRGVGFGIAPRTELLFADSTGSEGQLRFFAISSQDLSQNSLESPSILLMPEWNRVFCLVRDNSGKPAPAIAEYVIDYDYIMKE